MEKTPSKADEDLISYWIFFMAIGGHVVLPGGSGMPSTHLTFWQLTHHLSCIGSGDEFKGIDCKIFTDPHPMLIEMMNAMNSLSANQSLVTMPPWSNLSLIGSMCQSFALHFVILHVDVLYTVFQVTPPH
ncbi:LOW QUALITY PROTEIN: AAEL017576-PA [Aedes aegypti]|uniref:AAEL017576-PA n=1 Tax=Aedes aegypti TaxID=7159 RepID=J9HGI1_AEDAE|nr:LOW QUALITY PROTEIN: AAEL017576-PA [Aedes aegypti]